MLQKQIILGLQAGLQKTVPTPCPLLGQPHSSSHWQSCFWSLPADAMRPHKTCSFWKGIGLHRWPNTCAPVCVPGYFLAPPHLCKVPNPMAPHRCLGFLFGFWKACLPSCLLWQKHLLAETNHSPPTCFFCARVWNHRCFNQQWPTRIVAGKVGSPCFPIQACHFAWHGSKLLPTHFGWQRGKSSSVSWALLRPAATASACHGFKQ